VEEVIVLVEVVDTMAEAEAEAEEEVTVSVEVEEEVLAEEAEVTVLVEEGEILAEVEDRHLSVMEIIPIVNCLAVIFVLLFQRGKLL
jgi:hypothetical protein